MCHIHNELHCVGSLSQHNLIASVLAGNGHNACVVDDICKSELSISWG